MLNWLTNFLLALLTLILSLWFGNPIPIRFGRKKKVDKQNVEVIIVGAGVSGLEIGKRLKDIGLERFTILEKGAEIGGTWYWNKVKPLGGFPIMKIQITKYILSSIRVFNVIPVLLPTPHHGSGILTGPVHGRVARKYRHRKVL